MRILCAAREPRRACHLEIVFDIVPDATIAELAEAVGVPTSMFEPVVPTRN
jgi:hypothetical protein